ncbi:serine/threonine-protein kinase [Aspergillus homomorphus CBS 101889]|uniref:Serine/threonine-protein kinase ATG1 n=1 Tax=Aspergillus homomorphus (strain CBS 101889) TaxID=1450537 RepID=A0A395I3Y1_ASPHC|nr:kinase-like protein [Aspergillus homomorphus CBS 101889]RAL14790.1 kinase-like protein [Aspergillus homomorphus CBS 101889]
MERDKINYKREVLALAKFSKRQYQQQEVLVNFLGWLDDPSNLYLYMEYFPLGDLEGHISQPISEEEVKDIAMNLLNGLCIIHAEHFAHRDLKPGNIFVVRKPPTARWWVKIGDFGIAKRVNHERTALQTSIGTPQYLAPEVSGDLDLDEPTSVYNNAVDIWSLGCVIYRIATQHNPFPARTDLRRFCSGRKPFPEEPLRNTMEPDGVKFVKALISPFPNERPSAQAASEMAWLQGDFSTVTQEVARARSDGKSTPNRRLYGTRQAQRPARVVNLSSDNSHVQEDRGNAHNQGPQQDAPQNSFNSNPRDNPTIEDAIRNMIRPELEKLRREGYPRHFFRRGNVQPGFPVPVATPYVSDSGKRP